MRVVTFDRLWLLLLKVVDILEVLKFLGLFVVDNLVLGYAHVLFRVVVDLVFNFSFGFLLQIRIAQLQFFRRAAFWPIFLIGALHALLLFKPIVNQFD